MTTKKVDKTRMTADELDAMLSNLPYEVQNLDGDVALADGRVIEMEEECRGWYRENESTGRFVRDDDRVRREWREKGWIGENEELKARLAKQVELRSKGVIESELDRAIDKALINPVLKPAVKAKMRKRVIAELDPETQDIAVKATKEFGGEPVDAMLQSWARENRAYLIPASGGDATGGGPRIHPKKPAALGPANPFSREHWNFTKVAQLIKKDRAAADRLAREAGFMNAASARR